MSFTPSVLFYDERGNPQKYFNQKNERGGSNFLLNKVLKSNLPNFSFFFYDERGNPKKCFNPKN